VIANKTFKNMTMIKHFRMTQTDQNYIHKEIKSRINLGNHWAIIQFSVFCVPSPV